LEAKDIDKKKGVASLLWYPPSHYWRGRS